MTMTIEELRAHQKKSAEATVSAAAKQEKKKDERFWEPTVADKDAKISRAIIRPISCVATEDQNVVVQTTHFIKKNNRYYSFVCPKTSGKSAKCPVCERYWSQPYGQRDMNLRPRKKWIMNIYVVDDTGNPENNGKTFLWACPKTIWDKIEAARTEQYEDERVENIFDLWEGANILVRTKDKAGFMNYEDSTIRSKSALFPELEETNPKYIQVAESAYPLREFVEAGKEKTYAELAEMLNEIDGLVEDSIDKKPSNYVKVNNLDDEVEEFVDEAPTTVVEEKTTEEDFFTDFEPIND